MADQAAALARIETEFSASRTELVAKIALLEEQVAAAVSAKVRVQKKVKNQIVN